MMQLTLQAEQAALEKQIAASQRASETEARLQEQSQVGAAHSLAENHNHTCTPSRHSGATSTSIMRICLLSAHGQKEGSF